MSTPWGITLTGRLGAVAPGAHGSMQVDLCALFPRQARKSEQVHAWLREHMIEPLRKVGVTMQVALLR